jgi:hypothetical protein
MCVSHDMDGSRSGSSCSVRSCRTTVDGPWRDVAFNVADTGRTEIDDLSTDTPPRPTAGRCSELAVEQRPDGAGSTRETPFADPLRVSDRARTTTAWRHAGQVAAGLDTTVAGLRDMTRVRCDMHGFDGERTARASAAVLLRSCVPRTAGNTREQPSTYPSVFAGFPACSRLFALPTKIGLTRPSLNNDLVWKRISELHRERFEST